MGGRTWKYWPASGPVFKMYRHWPWPYFDTIWFRRYHLKVHVFRPKNVTFETLCGVLKWDRWGYDFSGDRSRSLFCTSVFRLWLGRLIKHPRPQFIAAYFRVTILRVLVVWRGHRRVSTSSAATLSGKPSRRMFAGLRLNMVADPRGSSLMADCSPQRFTTWDVSL